VRTRDWLDEQDEQDEQDVSQSVQFSCVAMAWQRIEIRHGGIAGWQDEQDVYTQRPKIFFTNYARTPNTLLTHTQHANYVNAPYYTLRTYRELAVGSC
jgi:hypothetical protein